LNCSCVHHALVLSADLLDQRLGTWGVFNFNNRILFTHDLLDEYTSAYTSSETPFVGWVATVSR
jgi:hypothetical protein